MISTSFTDVCCLVYVYAASSKYCLSYLLSIKLLIVRVNGIFYVIFSVYYHEKTLKLMNKALFEVKRRGY